MIVTGLLNLLTLSVYSHRLSICIPYAWVLCSVYYGYDTDENKKGINYEIR